MGATRIDTRAAAVALAERLNASHRPRPIVLVSTSAATNEPWIDVDELVDELEGLADLYVIVTGEATWSLSRCIPPKTEAYGGAGRVYPTDNSWVNDLDRSPLRFAFDPASGQRATRALISDALRFATRIGGVPKPAGPRTRPAAGIVKRIPTPDRAFVELDNGTLATIAQELTVPSVPLENVLVDGMRVQGSFDEGSKRLDISASVRPPEEVLASYLPGATVLARVEVVRSASARLALYPGVEAWVRGTDVTSNELDDFRTLMTRGEVVVAHLVASGPVWRLRLADVDDDEEPLVAPAILEGGPPWLEPPIFDVPVTVAAPEPFPVALQWRVEAPAEQPPIPAPHEAPHGTRPDLADLQSRLAQAESRLAALQGERDLLAKQLAHAQNLGEHLRREAKQLRTQARRRGRESATEELGGQFTDPEQQLRFEIEHRWAMRIPAADKDRLPLSHYTIGPEFLESVQTVHGVSRPKIIDVIVEVLTGLAKDIDGRKLHRLRESEAGGADFRVRPSDGAQAMRVNLQTNTPSARRLHYWQLKDGSIELARVVVHDDFTI